MNADQEAWIVRAMCEPSFYDHPVAEVSLIETHISWVFLAGDFAYKVKKPLNFGFLDFSTLAKRHHYCQEELRLNRRFTSRIYLALTSIGGSPDAPVINKQPALEYAVKMRRFPLDRQLDRMLAAGQLQDRHILAFATKIATLHQDALAAETGTPYGSPDAVAAPALENFQEIRPLVKEPDVEGLLAKLHEWTRKSFDSLQPVLQQRKDRGFIRECHGDVHLANMAWLEDQPLLFDCIEFNENLRWIDVANDIAFLLMDLDDRGQAKLGWCFLNRYLQETGDYQCVKLMNFYKTYRAMVRAKVICLRLAQGHLEESQRCREETLYKSYLSLAEQYTVPHVTPLIISHGLSGAGKTTFCTQLAKVFGAIHLRSDVERKRQHGLSANAKSESPLCGGIYSAKAFADTYAGLRDLANLVLRAGFPVLIDATFIRKQHRDLFSRLAEQLQVPFVILDFQLSEEQLRRRITERPSGATGDASEATLEVLEYQLEQEEPLTAFEEQLSIKICHDTGVETLAKTLRDQA